MTNLLEDWQNSVVALDVTLRAVMKFGGILNANSIPLFPIMAKKDIAKGTLNKILKGLGYTIENLHAK